MKKLIITSLVFFVSFFGLQAQNSLSAVSHTEPVTKEKVNNYVVLTRKIPQLKPILLAAEQIKKEDGKNFGKFEIVVCGKTVQKMTDNKSIQPFLKQAKKLGIKIHACGFSLKKFGVNQKDLPQDLEVVENGIYFNLDLQRKGYKSIEL